MSEEQAPASDATSPRVAMITTYSPEGVAVVEKVQMVLESPVEGIHIVPGFTQKEVLGYIIDFIHTLADEIMQADVPPTLIFPLDGAVFAYDLLMIRLFISGYEHFSDLKVVFAAATGDGAYVVPDYHVREGARVIVVDDIADRLGAFQAIAEAIDMTPELYAMSRKATTDIKGFTGYPIQAVFPLIDGDDPWCNSGFGMNKDRKSSTIVRVLERLAAVCVIGEAVDEEAYIAFLIENSYYAQVLHAPIYDLLTSIDQESLAGKLRIMREYHQNLLITLKHPEP